MTDRYRGVLDALAAAGWTVRERTATVLAPSEVWPAGLRERYPNAPAALTDFVARIDACIKPDERAWFLTTADYAGTSDSAFAWNEWERFELESYEEEDDADAAAEVRAFWRAYLPFYLDVGGDYAYFAVRVAEPKPAAKEWLPGAARPVREPSVGSVVHGAAVDFRGVSQVAGSFPEFLDHLAAAVRDPRRDGPLTGLV